MTPEQLKASILQYAIQGKLVEQRPEEGTGEELYRQIQAEKQRLIKEGKIKKEKALPEIAEDEIPFDLPDSWKWVRLNAVIVLLSGSDLTPNKYNNSCKGIPYITGASNIEGEKLVINRWTEYPNNIAHNGDLLLTCKGTVGKTTILNEPEVHIARQLMAITAIELNLKYLKYFVESHVDVLKAKAKSLIPGIERDNVLKLLLPLPPLAEQHRIVAKIEELLPYVDRYAAAYEKLEQFNAKFPEDMKKSILQYAIQGKLVEQRPEEGTGKELYRQIQEEKKRLIKEGTIKKEKPLAEIAEDEIPFDIPENWKWVQLGNLASINGGFAFKSTNYRNVGDSPAINVYTLADIELQFSEDSAGNKKLLPASLLPGFTQALSAEEETDINIHFETSEVKALICELRKASEKNWERLRTNPSHHHYTGAKLIVRVFFKNLMGQWCESTISYEIAWLAYKNPAPQKTHNLNENTIPPKEIREGDEFKAVLSSHHIAPFVFAMTTDKHVIDVLQGYTDESPWLSAVLKDNYT